MSRKAEQGLLRWLPQSHAWSYNGVLSFLLISREWQLLSTSGNKSVLGANPDVIARKADQALLQQEWTPTKPSLSQIILKIFVGFKRFPPWTFHLWNSSSVSQNKRECTQQEALQKFFSPRHCEKQQSSSTKFLSFLIITYSQKLLMIYKCLQGKNLWIFDHNIMSCLSSE